MVLNWLRGRGQCEVDGNLSGQGGREKGQSALRCCGEKERCGGGQ